MRSFPLFHGGRDRTDVTFLDLVFSHNDLERSRSNETKLLALTSGQREQLFDSVLVTCYFNYQKTKKRPGQVSVSWKQKGCSKVLILSLKTKKKIQINESTRNSKFLLLLVSKRRKK